MTHTPISGLARRSLSHRLVLLLLIAGNKLGLALERMNQSTKKISSFAFLVNDNQLESLAFPFVKMSAITVGAHFKKSKLKLSGLSELA